MKVNSTLKIQGENPLFSLVKVENLYEPFLCFDISRR